MLYTDQLHRSITINNVPKRIVSLVPSQSEYLWDIGLNQQLVGVSKFCIHPKQMFDSVARIGGTKQLDIERIRVLKPDLIIGNKEENVKEQIEALRSEFNVWMSDVNTMNEAYDMMLRLGEICGKKEQSRDMVNAIADNMARVKNIFNGARVAYLIWYKPYMAAANNTFIDSVMQECGMINHFGDEQRYPQILPGQLQGADLCFLSSEPFPFEQKHITELEAVVKNCRMALVDGEMFSWYGSRLRLLPNYLKMLKKQVL